jgi:hypothetical protein
MLSSDEQPIWRTQGLVNYAIENLADESEDNDEDDE